MDTKTSDKTVSRILRTVTKKSNKPDDLRKSRDEFNRAIGPLPEVIAKALSQSFDAIKDHWHHASRLSSSSLMELLKTLTHYGYNGPATILFTTCVDLLLKENSISLGAILPSAACADLWIKKAKASKRTILQSIATNQGQYDGTAWCSWYVTKAPPKLLGDFAVMTLRNHLRAKSSPNSSSLLTTILMRDKKHTLAIKLLKEAVPDEAAIKAVIKCCYHVEHSHEVYARELGLLLSSQTDLSLAKHVADSLLALMGTSDPSASMFYARFTAHMITTLNLSSNTLTIEGNQTNVELQRISNSILLTGQGANTPDYLVACPVKAITQTFLSVDGKISPQGAMEVALALRSAQTTTKPYDSLWAMAFNLGIRQLGEPGIQEAFNPLIHEDLKGGLLRGNNCKLLRAGWKNGDTILLRAQVEPA